MSMTAPDPFKVIHGIVRECCPSLDEDCLAESARTGKPADLIRPAPLGVERAPSLRLLGGLNAVRMSPSFLALLGARVAMTKRSIGGDVYVRLHKECLAQASKTLKEYGAEEPVSPPLGRIVFELLGAYLPDFGASLSAA